MSGPQRDLALDRLTDPDAGIEVLAVEDASVGIAADGPRAPHRHDYHELIWACSGEGRHLIDGAPVPVRPRTLTLIGRGQVHVFEGACNLTGAVIRFGEEMLFEGHVARANPGWLLHGTATRIVDVPGPDVARLEALIGTLRDELDRPLDATGVEVRRHLLSCLLLWMERWHDAADAGTTEPPDRDALLVRRFMTLLERDHARHHDAAHYAPVLGVPAAALSRALVAHTGRTTKEMVTDRVMLEATRLVRFTDLTMGEIAHRVGFRDQMYFSRAFRRHRGRAPSEERALHRAG